MFQKLKYSPNRIFPTLVVSTMSSGKSTLINALVGCELLPSRNSACTARAIAILDNDLLTQFRMHTIDKSGKYCLVDKASAKLIEEFNQSGGNDEIIIEGQIRGIKNSKKSLLLIDTPGINNSMNLEHEQVTKHVLDNYSEGLILYIINAQQIGTYDDSNFLSLIAGKLNHNPKFKIIFAVNKMDLIDDQKENPCELIDNCRKYIEDKGIINPTLIPIAASSALVFRKVLGGETLSELEEENFSNDYKYFKGSNRSLVNFAYIPERGKLDETVEVDGEFFTKAQIYAALENTGLPLLEMIIDEALVDSLKMKAPRITVNRGTNNGKRTRKNE